MTNVTDRIFVNVSPCATATLAVEFMFQSPMLTILFFRTAPVFPASIPPTDLNAPDVILMSFRSLSAPELVIFPTVVNPPDAFTI